MSSNRLTNSFYSVYGTHPIRVPHSNSMDAIQTRSSDFAIPTTHSLENFVDQPINDDDDEVKSDRTSTFCFSFLRNVQTFEDASDTFHSDILQKPSNDPMLIDWTQAFLECDEINKLFFKNHVNEALHKTMSQ